MLHLALQGTIMHFGWDGNCRPSGE